MTPHHPDASEAFSRRRETINFYFTDSLTSIDTYTRLITCECRRCIMNDTVARFVQTARWTIHNLPFTVHCCSLGTGKKYLLSPHKLREDREQWTLLDTCTMDIHSFWWFIEMTPNVPAAFCCVPPPATSPSANYFNNKSSSVSSVSLSPFLSLSLPFSCPVGRAHSSLVFVS